MENWNDRKVRLKQKLSLLLNIDSIFDESAKNELLSKLHIALGRNKAELAQIIEDIQTEKT